MARDRNREEERERDAWQFHSDHLNVQTIRDFILETRRCVCTADYHSHPSILTQPHSPQLTSGKVQWSSHNTLTTAVVGRLSIAVDFSHSYSIFSFSVKIQINNLLVTFS